jgi:hypothetical protein
MLRPFSFGARFETYEPFIYLIFHFFFVPRKSADTESVDTGARLYIVNNVQKDPCFLPATVAFFVDIKPCNN